MNAADMILEALSPRQMPKPHYNAYFAHRIVKDLRRSDPEKIIASVDDAKVDHRTGTRTIDATDFQGKRYRITIESLEEVECSKRIDARAAQLVIAGAVEGCNGN